MTNKNFNYLNISVLISHSSSNLNRDDANMQKTAFFGGASRARISSQCLKHAMRHSTYYRENLGKPSIRTIRLTDLSDHVVKNYDQSIDPDSLVNTIAVMAGVDLSKPNAGKKKKPSEEDVNKIFSSAIAAWSVDEIIKAHGIVEPMIKSGADFKAITKELKKQSASFRKCLENAIDIGLSGRMITEGTMASVDGSLSLAHSFTTHRIEPETDWFTATDDIRSLMDAKGSAHMNSFDYSSGVFYRYANLNIRQLQENLGDATREEALEIAKHLVYMMATVVPEAKQKSFAAHNLADFALVSFSDSPFSLANAFERPIWSETGYLSKSCESLLDYWKKVSEAYELDGRSMIFTTQDDITVDNTTQKMSDLTSWVSQDGRSQ